MQLVSSSSPLAPGDRPTTGDDVLAGPFTPAMAARAGLGRARLERLLRDGQVLRLVRGLYVAADVSLTSLERGRALAQVVGSRHIVVGRTAAWVHGAAWLGRGAGTSVPLDLHGRYRCATGQPAFRDGEVILLGGIRCTSAARTAVDVAREHAADRALPVLDALLREGALTHRSMIAAGRALAGWPGGAAALDLVAAAEGRSASVAESVLRLHWLRSSLPTPVPGAVIEGTRVALALPVQRFAVALSRVPAPDGWRVLVLAPEQVVTGDQEALVGFLQRAFHRHLLSQVESSTA